MTDKEFNRIKKVLEKLLKKWVDLLNLRSWEVVRAFDRSPNESAAATCKAKWQYKWMKITFFCSELADYSDNELEEVVVHELIHGRVNEMREWGPKLMDKELADQGHDHEERVVTEITQCFLWLERGKRKK